MSSVKNKSLTKNLSSDNGSDITTTLKSEFEHPKSELLPIFVHMANICLVEDEQKVAAFICKGLEEHNFKVKTAKDGASAKALLQSSDFDLLIMDVMLPDINGIELWTRCKAKFRA